MEQNTSVKSFRRHFEDVPETFRRSSEGVQETFQEYSGGLLKA